MNEKKRLFVNWLAGSILVLVAFYSAVSWLWRSSEESAASSLRGQVVSALSGDLAEGNFLKLGATLSRLRSEGYIKFAEIRQVQGASSSFIYRTAGPEYGLDTAFSVFSCTNNRIVLRLKGGGIGIATTLPGSMAGADCIGVFISSDLPAGLRTLKTKIVISFGALIIFLMAFVLVLTIGWHKKMVALEVTAKTALTEKEAIIGRLAAQVAHDIRSPLTALDAALKNAAQMPEEQRIIVRHAVNRIRDIANNLLEKNRQQAKATTTVGAGAAADEPSEICLLSSIVDPVVTEKRLQFQSKPGINIDFELTRESYGLFAKIRPVEFKRLVSNLVNNAVEALESHKTQVTGHKPEDTGHKSQDTGHKQEGTKGEMAISLSSEDGKVILAVKDSGQGIPPEILAKLGQRGETHGKAGGSGLGLFHARTTAEGWGGSLEIKSEIGKGTTVIIKLPAAEPPAWFVSKLELPAGKAVVVLDDDETIHQVWQGRFESARVKEHNIETFHFSEPDKLRGWVKDNPAKAESAVYLFDFELLGYKETGLSLAEELGLSGKVILVTSRYEEQRITEECRRLKIRMIPKGLAGLVPITAANSGERIANSEETETKTVGSAPVSGAEAVLIDDDALVHMTWKMSARNNGITLKAFKAPAEFLSGLEAFPKDTPIYIDSELGDGIKGEDIAKTIHARGFEAIYLETGHPPERFAGMTWIKEVISKDPPWDNDSDR